jgi:hypothetical protein
VVFRDVYVTEYGAMPAAEIGLSEAAVGHGFAANNDVPHGRMMSVDTDSDLEIAISAILGGFFGAHVDLGAAAVCPGWNRCWT